MLIACIVAMSFVQPAVEEVSVQDQVDGFWGGAARVELETPGGALPFILEVYIPPALASGGLQGMGFRGVIDAIHKMDIRVVNGSETIRAGEVLRGGVLNHVNAKLHGTISFDHYDAQLIGEGKSGHVIGVELARYMTNGYWSVVRGDSVVQVPFTMIDAYWSDNRFDPIEDAGEPAAFTGRWSVDFDSSDDLAVGAFTVDADQIASGTFLTTTGDYRYLAGRVDGNLMRLSTFDGAHAFLFHARMQDDGSIEGDFWSGNWHHETWTAVRDDDAALPDAFEQTKIADESAIGEMVFKDSEGTPTRVLDVLDESNAKARIIEIFGTWCPNCSDAGRELVSLKEKYGDDLAIVGLAFEITADFERSVEQVRRHHEHIGTNWPILIAGLSDKDKASAALPMLDRVRSYPTLIFLDKHNAVQAVYSGFSGPATGEAYVEQRRRFEEVIDGLIGE